MRINNGGTATIPPTQATDVEVAAAITAHEALADPHPGYDTAAETATAVATHAGLADPHTGYRLESADHSHLTTGLQGGQVPYGALSAVAAQDYNPVLNQSGNITSYTTRIGHYIQFGKLVLFWGQVTVNNATGAVAGNPINVSLPVTARADALFLLGTGVFIDISANIFYKGHMQIFTSTSFVLMPSNDISVDATNFYLGNKVYTAIVATGDIVHFCGLYEAL